MPVRDEGVGCTAGEEVTYSPLAVSDYFNQRVRDFYPIPDGIIFQLFDHGYPNGEPDWHIEMTNVSHETPWEAPFGRIDGPDFSRMFFKIALEIEAKFGAKFPRKVKQ